MMFGQNGFLPYHSAPNTLLIVHYPQGLLTRASTDLSDRLEGSDFPSSTTWKHLFF